MKISLHEVRITKTFWVVAANETDDIWQAALRQEDYESVDEDRFEVLQTKELDP